MADVGQKSHSQRVDAIEAAQQQLAELLVKAEDAEIDPKTVRPQDGHERLQRRLHLATIDFWREMRPYRDRAHEKWATPLPLGSSDSFEFEVPDRDTSTVNTKDRSVNEARLSAAAQSAHQQQQKRRAVRGDNKRPQFATSSEKIRLGDLGEWRNRFVYYTGYEFEPERGLVEVERKERVLLPLDACEAIYDALTDVRDHIPNLGTEIGERGYIPSDDEVLRIDGDTA